MIYHWRLIERKTGQLGFWTPLGQGPRLDLGKIALSSAYLKLRSKALKAILIQSFSDFVGVPSLGGPPKAAPHLGRQLTARLGGGVQTWWKIALSANFACHGLQQQLRIEALKAILIQSG